MFFCGQEAGGERDCRDKRAADSRPYDNTLRVFFLQGRILSARWADPLTMRTLLVNRLEIPHCANGMTTVSSYGANPAPMLA